MPQIIESPSFPNDHADIVTRAANEGIPVAAIARIIQQPFDLVADVLENSLETGLIAQMPTSDWPPTVVKEARLPTVPRTANAVDVLFVCRKVFNLTNLESGFLMTLLRFEYITKEKLHGVIEQQRSERLTKPDSMDMTDQKMVDVMICKLRKKLKAKDPSLVITTSWGVGYYLDAATKQKIYDMIGRPYACGPAPA